MAVVDAYDALHGAVLVFGPVHPVLGEGQYPLRVVIDVEWTPCQGGGSPF